MHFRPLRFGLYRNLISLREGLENAVVKKRRPRLNYLN